MKKSFAVVGLGRFGTNVALTLMESGAQVLAIDSNPECVKRISSQVTCAVTVNVCETESLKEAGLENMDGVVVAMGNNLEASAMTIITAKELDFRRSYNMNIILVKEDGRSIDHITPELQLKESYRLLVTISNEGLKRMMQ